MKFSLKDCKIETMRSRGKGGQNVNKVNSAVRITHIPTQISVRIEGRDQGQNKKNAIAELQKRLNQLEQDEKAKVKKDNRDYKIHNTRVIRTYDFKTGIVKDHRTGKKAPIKEVVGKGNLDLLR